MLGLFSFLISINVISMQILPVANLGYLCLPLQWAEYELQGREKEKETEPPQGCHFYRIPDICHCTVATVRLL